jgi:hypothetical protein
VPPWAVAISRTMYRPSPMLPGVRRCCTDVCPRVSGSKIVASRGAGIGSPVLWTVMATVSASAPSALRSTGSTGECPDGAELASGGEKFYVTALTAPRQAG